MLAQDDSGVSQQWKSAAGYPARENGNLQSCSVLISGRDASIVNGLLFVLSYFVRIADVIRYGSVFGQDGLGRAHPPMSAGAIGAARAYCLSHRSRRRVDHALLLVC